MRIDDRAGTAPAKCGTTSVTERSMVRAVDVQGRGGQWVAAAIIAIGACSSPSGPRTQLPVVEVPRDAAVTDVVAAATDDAAYVPSVDAAPARAVDVGPRPKYDKYAYRFEWQQLRDDYEAFKKAQYDPHGCDFQVPPSRQSVVCHGPHGMAGRAVQTGSGTKPGTAGIVIDRGARVMITMDWKVALLDDEGHPITPWAPLDHLRRDDESYANVETTPWVAAQHLHVGMRIDQRLRDAKIHRMNHYR
jgi:hypothetical protein